MGDKTGFTSFLTYHNIKNIYFKKTKKDNTYNIENGCLVRREHFCNIWNNKMIKRRDSLYFSKLDKKFTKQEILEVMSIYCIKNNSFYVTNIFEDNMSTFKNYMSGLTPNAIERSVENSGRELLLLSNNTTEGLSKVLYSNSGLPEVFKLYDRNIIGFTALIAFNNIFNLIDKINVESLDIVEKERYTHYWQLTKRFYLIFRKYFEKIDTLEVLRKNT